MIKHGEPPYLECSSQGFKPFSAFFARLPDRDNKTIEELYQAYKIFTIDGEKISGLTWRQAKGRRAENAEECAKFYSQLWDEYINLHPTYVDELIRWPGLSDQFGHKGTAVRPLSFGVFEVGMCDDPRSNPCPSATDLCRKGQGLRPQLSPHRGSDKRAIPRWHHAQDGRRPQSVSFIDVSRYQVDALCSELETRPPGFDP